MKKRATALLLMTALALTACNTVQGLGRDLSSAGDAVADAAK